MSVWLLDVNVLIALFDPVHVNHSDAHQWFSAQPHRRWATCPLTENGCTRILSRSQTTQLPVTVPEAASRLRERCDDRHHEFWPDSPSLLDERTFRLKLLTGPNQLTDVYLLALAVAHGGKLVTFDRSIPWKAVKDASAASLELLGQKH